MPKDFFRIQYLKNKSEYYLNNYSIIPIFKAGLNVSEVTVAKAGEIKKELACHGDVLNTAARIESLCNNYHKSLLISESIKIELERQKGFCFDFIDYVRLKGKEQSINIYDVIPSITN